MIRYDCMIPPSDLIIETVRLIDHIFNRPEFPEVVLANDRRYNEGLCTKVGDDLYEISFGGCYDPLTTPSLLLHEIGHTIERKVCELARNMGIPVELVGSDQALGDHDIPNLFACYILEPERLKKQKNKIFGQVYTIFKELLGKEFSPEDTREVVEAALKERQEIQSFVEERCPHFKAARLLWTNPGYKPSPWYEYLFKLGQTG